MGKVMELRKQAKDAELKAAEETKDPGLEINAHMVMQQV